MASTTSTMLTIWCFLVGGLNPFHVDIDESKTVSHLRKQIKAETTPVLVDVPLHDLTLYRVAVDCGDLPSRVNQLNQLAQNLNMGDPLDGEDQLSGVWKEPPAGQKYYIVVQAPKGTGNKRRVRGNGENDTDDGQPPRKRKKKSKTHLDGRRMPDLLKSVSSLYDKISSSTLDLDDFCDPSRNHYIPWPSPLEPPDRFETLCLEDQPPRIQYMGRSIFKEVWKEATGDGFDTFKFNELYLYGPSGMGKSHVLAALVFSLVQRGDRVVYIPDCRRAAKKPYKNLQKALLFAFHGEEVLQRALAEAENLDELKDVIDTQSSKSFYLIVDQLNALDVDDRNEDSDVRDLYTALKSISDGQKYIFSASAGAKSNRAVDKKQTSIKVIRFNVGMTSVETDTWFKYHAPDFPKRYRPFVEDMTGCIPLLLRSLSQFKKGDKFKEDTFLGCKELRTVEDNILAFYNKILLDHPGNEQYREIMSVCISGGRLAGALPEFYDMRYFYSDEMGEWHYSCGMARQTLISVYRRHTTLKTDFDPLLTVIRESSNGSVRGFLLEQLCLQVIMNKGLRFIPNADEDAPTGPLQREFFLEIPDWSKLIDEEPQHSCRLYLPQQFNYANVDGAVLHLVSRNPKKAHLYLIQVTLAMKHKDSAKHFYEDQWNTWVRGLVSSGWDLESTFLWIDRSQPKNRKVARKTTPTLRSGEIVVHPGYNVWRTGFGPLDTRFENLLS